MSDQELVKRCLKDICGKNGFHDVSAMTQRDFELISQEIATATGILISVSTIKRLLHGNFSRIPQTATLNAISSYMGFKNWQDYKNSIHNGTRIKTSETQIDDHFKTKKGYDVFQFSWKWMAGVAFVAGIIIFFSFIKVSSKRSPDYEKAQFAVKKTTGNSIPNTVIFNYNIDDVNADSFFIQQSWDKTRRVQIYKHRYTLTDIYYEPGYHIAKLIADDSVIKTMDVSIPTDKWFFYAKDKRLSGSVEYLKPASQVKNGCLSLDKADLHNNHINTDGEKSFVYSYFPSKINSSSDNFILRTRIKMNEVRNNQCPYIMFEVFCQRWFMYFKSMTKGCASETQAQFGENLLSGKGTDLSSLCYDLNQWIDIEWTVKNKLVSVSFNDKQVFSSVYDNSSGLITGLGFISNGLCEVDFTELKGVDGKIIYANDFNTFDPGSTIP